MKKQKRFAFILIILFCLVLISGGVYFYSQNNKDVRVNTVENTSINVKNISSTTNETSVKDKDKPIISVGDRLGSMTVMSVEPFNSGQYSNQFTDLAANNIKIKLSGAVILTGEYFFDDYIGFYCMSNFDEDSLKKLPSPSFIQETTTFCFRNEDFAKDELGKAEKRMMVTVKIDNFEIHRYPAEVTDLADLVEVY